MVERKADFINETIAFWQPYTDEIVTPELAKEMVDNISGFFRILLEWDEADQMQQNGINQS